MAVRSFYRSTMFAVRSAWFVLKWGTVFGSIAWMFGAAGGGDILQRMGMGVGGGRNNPGIGDYLNTLLGSSPARRRPYRSQTSTSTRTKRPSRVDEPPTILDSFDKHRSYASRRQQAGPLNGDPVDAGGGAIEEVLDQLYGAWSENGQRLWETFGKVAGFVDLDEEEEGVASRTRSKAKKGRTKNR